MNQNNKDFIIRFYAALQTKNYREMQEAYHPEAEFFDPVFGKLTCAEVQAMWQMLLSRSKDLEVVFSNVHATQTAGKCRWEAWYTFSKTGRFVHNVIQSSFEFRDGKIYRQKDSFNIWRWSRHALGPTGLFLGWSPLVQNKVKAAAKENLQRFMAANISK